jgi:hypothetical protein
VGVRGAVEPRPKLVFNFEVFLLVFFVLHVYY